MRIIERARPLAATQDGHSSSSKYPVIRGLGDELQARKHGYKIAWDSGKYGRHFLLWKAGGQHRLKSFNTLAY